MADTPTEQTGPLDAGHTTTEFKLSVVSVFLGGLATVLGYATTILQVLPADLKWVGVASAVVGLLTVLLTSLGYQVTRASIKNAGQAAAAQVAAAKAAAPPAPIGEVAEKVFGT